MKIVTSFRSEITAPADAVGWTGACCVLPLLTVGLLAVCVYWLPKSSGEERGIPLELHTRRFVLDEKPLQIGRSYFIGVEQKNKQSFELRSATVSEAPKHVYSYRSVAVLADAHFAPGDFHIVLDAGIQRLDTSLGPLVLSLRIGGHYYDFEFARDRLVFKGVMLDASRYQTYNVTYAAAPIGTDGERWRLELIRRTSRVQVLVNGNLLHVMSIEATGGGLAVFIERRHFLRDSLADDVQAVLSIENWQATACFVKKPTEQQAWELASGPAAGQLKRLGNA